MKPPKALIHIHTRFPLRIVSVCATLACALPCLDQLSAASTMTYPQTRQTNHVDEYHGVKVADPYRWHEDDNSDETKAWVEAQNKVAFGYLEQSPERKAIQARLTKL